MGERDDDGMFGLDGDRDPVAGPLAGEPPGGRRRVLLIALAAMAAVAALVVALGTAAAAPTRPVATGTRTPTTPTPTTPTPTTPTPATPSSPAPMTPTVPVQEPSTPSTTPTVYADPAALADLRAVAATLTRPLTLTSPAGWDQWLPAGKPYPGTDTADDMSTCPRMADRLGAALGRKMSYWVGTLPGGPYGCQWATVPLYAGPNSPNYPYLASIGFLDDGTTTLELSNGFYHHQGRLCPSVAVPAVGRGAYLVRCDDVDGLTYVLVARDTRTAGIWCLIGTARSTAAHSARDVFRTVVAGAAHAYG